MCAQLGLFENCQADLAAKMAVRLLATALLQMQNAPKV
jgi:hypothetical protein